MRVLGLVVGLALSLVKRVAHNVRVSIAYNRVMIRTILFITDIAK